MRLIRLNQVIELTALGRTSVYKLMNENSFPKPVTTIGKCKAWIESEILEWIEDRIQQRDDSN